MNVLVAEKDPVVGSHLVELINGWGYHAKSAESGEATLNLAADTAFDLVLLDTALPDMGTRELITSLKDLSPDPGIVTMTESHQNGFEEDIRTLGIIYYMLKPINELVLKDILDHISRKRQESGGRINGFFSAETSG